MENPTIDETPQAPEAPKAEAAPNPHADLLAELEKFGVKNAEQLQGKMVASQEAGRLANQLGDARKEISEMRTFMERLAHQKPAAQPKDDWGAEPAQQNAGTIDLGNLVEQSIEKAITKRERVAMEQQKRAWDAWNRIQGDPDFHIVKDKWEAKLKDPQFAVRFQAGGVDPYAEYQELLRDTYKSAVARSAEIIKSLTTGAGPPKVHMEGQGKVSGMRTEQSPERDKTLNPLREKVNKGKILSEDEELAALMKVLGGGG